MNIVSPLRRGDQSSAPSVPPVAASSRKCPRNFAPYTAFRTLDTRCKISSRRSSSSKLAIAVTSTRNVASYPAFAFSFAAIVPSLKQINVAASSIARLSSNAPPGAPTDTSTRTLPPRSSATDVTAYRTSSNSTHVAPSGVANVSTSFARVASTRAATASRTNRDVGDMLPMPALASMASRSLGASRGVAE